MKESIFDSQIRKALAKEAIAPRKELWERMSVMLQEKNSLLKEEPTIFNKKRYVSWYALAAALFGAAMLSAYIFKFENFKTEGTLEKAIPVVSSPVEIKVSTNTAALELARDKEQIKKSSLASVTAVAKKAVSNNIFKTKRVFPVPLHKALETQDISSEAYKNTVVATSIELLLENKLTAELEQTKNMIAQSMKASVTPSELLLEVEENLNQSFRAKVVQELKQNIVKVGQSMASRNQ